MIRESGFYWVKYRNDWEVARWCNTGDGWPEGWYFTTSELGFGDSDLTEIGPRLTPPDHAA